MSEKTDLLYGRRGGGWIDPDMPLPVEREHPSCDECGQPMTVGQRRRHLVCCATTRGDTPGDTCNPIKVKGEDVRRCAHCWAPAA